MCKPFPICRARRSVAVAFCFHRVQTIQVYICILVCLSRPVLLELTCPDRLSASAKVVHVVLMQDLVLIHQPYLLDCLWAYHLSSG